MTIKEEFKLVKKVLRKHGCLRAYRRMLRKEFNLSLLEHINVYCSLNGGYEILCPKEGVKDMDFWVVIDDDLYNQQLRIEIFEQQRGVKAPL